MPVLILLLIIDYLSAILLVLTGKRNKNSNVGFIGICKKMFIIMIVTVINVIQNIIGYNGIYETCIVFYCINEVISVLENAEEMGVKIPIKVKDMLNEEVDKNGNTEDAD